MRLIDADALKLAIRDDAEIVGRNYARIKMHINEAPTVEVVHGRWEDVALRFTQVREKCSVCGGIVYAHGFNYCPNCGARMDGENDG